MLETLSTLLKLEGHEVFTALDKEDILNILRNKQIDLILLDVYLHSEQGEEINGLELLDDIRRHPDVSDVRVLMTSGSDLREQVEQAGADGFLMKPYMPKDLLSSIQSQLAKQR